MYHEMTYKFVLCGYKKNVEVSEQKKNHSAYYHPQFSYLGGKEGASGWTPAAASCSGCSLYSMFQSPKKPSSGIRLR